MSHSPRIIVVLGMHRSGTSLVAKSLECLGASLGPRADWTGPDNPRGFFEDLDVLAINETILHEIGRAWDDPEPWGPSLDVFRALSSKAVHLSLIAERLLRSRLAEHPIYAVKEPRMCRLMPFWRPIFAAVGATVSRIHVVRHPMAVARSLERRNGMATGKALALWLEYTKAVREDWAPSVTVDYDAVMALPGAEIRRIGATLGLPIDEAALAGFATSFVDDTLWHEAERGGALPVEAAVAWGLEKLEAGR